MEKEKREEKEKEKEKGREREKREIRGEPFRVDHDARQSGTRSGRGRVPRLWREVACAERGDQDGLMDWVRVSDQGKGFGERFEGLSTTMKSFAKNYFSASFNFDGFSGCHTFIPLLTRFLYIECTVKQPLACRDQVEAPLL